EWTRIWSQVSGHAAAEAGPVEREGEFVWQARPGASIAEMMESGGLAVDRMLGTLPPERRQCAAKALEVLKEVLGGTLIPESIHADEAAITISVLQPGAAPVPLNGPDVLKVWAHPGIWVRVRADGRCEEGCVRVDFGETVRIQTCS